ncbi:MAG: alpha/beta fold hydrolase [Thermoleophilia bacterium]|nr:alpha/beta fold hydrolase [Thermoleophilia bacterium]MDQ3857924.1 alpha/beta fold hydrolase [Actinomycetota bacterium]
MRAESVRSPEDEGRLVAIGDTALFVVERGNGYPIIVLHGGPGLDHRMWGSYLDPLADRYRLVLVDQRSQGRSEGAPEETWTLERMAADVTGLAEALGLRRYATLGHSYGAFVVLQHAVDFPGHAAQTIVSSGIPASRFLADVERNLETFEPIELRDQVAASWEREKTVRTREECDELLHEQLPFHFADPRDPRIALFEREIEGGLSSPDVIRTFANAEYGGIDVEARLGEIPQAVLVLAGRHDRTCSVEAAEAIARGVPNAELVVFEESGHMTYVEENARYLAVVQDFLERHGR